MNGMRFGAGIVACALFCSAAVCPADAASGFKRVWERRFRFDNEIELGADRFVPAAHYSATVVSLPAEMRFVTDDGIVARFAAPEDVKPPYRMHLAVTGAHKPSVFIEKDGELKLAKIAEWPEGFDPRRKENLEMVRFSGTEGLRDRKVALSAGIGQADVRFVTSGRENRPYFENGRAFFTFSARAYGSYLGVMSFDPNRLDFRLEGVILFDYGDGLLRNDLAADLFYDDVAGEWRAYVSNFSTSDDSLKGRARGGVNVAWSKECPLRGLSVMRARNLGLPNMNEDPDGFWDARAKKWRLLVSEFTAKGIRAAMFESENWDGPFARLAGPVDVDSTGTTIAWIDGEPRALFGSATRKLCVRDYPTLSGDGELALSDPPWNPATSMNGRVWPALLDCPDGTRCLLTFDRVNFPGMPRPNWTYGKLILYRETAEAWEDETRLAENRLPPHAWFGSFPDVESARAILPDRSPRRLSLDSETDWRFRWSRRPSERPVGFENPGFDVSDWAVVKVPCSWQAAGIRASGERFGTPLYVNQPYVFTERFPADGTCYPRVTGLPVGKDWTFRSEDNPVGSYRRAFDVPADWIGDEMVLQFDGVESFFRLWVNGRYVGFSKNSRSPAAFDVTDLVRAGRNTVAVEVYRHSDGSYLECQDMFRLSGIIRSVGLTHRPKDHLADVRFTTRPVCAGVYDGDWALDLEVKTSGVGEVKARAFDAEGRETEVRVGETVFARPKPWSAEEPNLYTLVVSLERDGRCLEAAGFQLGFRQVEIREAADQRDRTFLFNGRPIKLKGVNRGETDPRYGHHVPDARIEEDLRLIKRGNFNHIRCSHFPQPAYFYYLCNKLGIYVMDEANLESHGTQYGEHSLSHAKSWEAAHVERQASMFEWNKNYPCIVIWSMGNEAGPGDNFKACYRYLKEKDPTRPVQYERNPWLTDLGSRQYPSVDWVQQCAAGDPTLTDGIQTNRPVHYPYHINEYAHNFNNACGNLADFQEAIESSTRIMGGAIWDWSNQALEMTCRGKRVLAWGGCFGEKPEEGQGILDGIVTSDRVPEPCYYEACHVFQNFSARLEEGGRVALTNKHYFRDSSAFACRWTLLRDGERTERGTFDVVLKPQETRRVDLPEVVRSAVARDDAELALRVEFVLKQAEGAWPQGRVIAADQLALADWKGRFPKGGGLLHYVFSKETGELVSLTRDGRELLKAPVTLDCFRVPVGGETTYREGRMYFGRERLLDGLRTMHPTLRSFDDRTDAQGVRRVRSVVAYRGARKEDMPRYGHVNEMEVEDLGPLADDAPGLEVTSEWTIAADGSARVKATFAAFGRPTEFQRVGWRFVFASPRTSVDYFACGPHDNYSDRKTGCFPARYAASSTSFGFAGDVTQDAGNREEARYVRLDEPGLSFTSTGSRRFAFQVSPYSVTELLRCPHPELLPSPTKTELGIYARVRGLGSANCGPKPLDRDIIAAGEVCTLEFALVGMALDFQ